MKSSDILKLSGSIIVAELAGVVGGLFTADAIATWYAYLSRPSFAPPNWVFGPVWVTLYALMGIAAFLVWRQGYERREVKVAMGVYAVQLVLNALWSVIFFGLRSPGIAFFEIILLLAAILWTIWTFSRVSRAAAILLLPYVLWVAFASALNLAFWALNGL